MELTERIAPIVRQIQSLYLEDDLPWVVGYSGGKDSTAVLQLVWTALAAIPTEQRTKKVYVISTDTLVENPIVAKWVERSLEKMNAAALQAQLSLEAHRLVPALEDRFWVNLIGKGYPAPRPMFRWCTSRLKINASTEFLLRVASERGEAILFLGTRRQESVTRARVMERYDGSTRALLQRNGDPKLDRVWIFPPIADWSSDDVWEYLATHTNPWGQSNDDLVALYRGATPDAECPLVVDSSTPSCGDSRFGCYVCTLVSEDKSMQAMIQNDADKKWMEPLAEFRQQYLSIKRSSIPIHVAKEGGADADLRADGGMAVTSGTGGRIFDRPVRDFRRIDGRVQLNKGFRELKEAHDKFMGDPKRQVLITTADGSQRLKDRDDSEALWLVPGPYKQRRRETLLRELLRAQRQIRTSASDELRHFELISLKELEAIRQIWVQEKHEIEDSLPHIYEEAMYEPYPLAGGDDNQLFSAEDIALLRELAGCTEQDDTMLFQLLREMLHIEQGYRNATRRVGIYDLLEKALRKHAFDSEDQAREYLLDRVEQLLISHASTKVDDGVAAFDSEETAEQGVAS